jgi:Xaa-Pro aminopeptidase
MRDGLRLRIPQSVALAAKSRDERRSLSLVSCPVGRTGDAMGLQFSREEHLGRIAAARRRLKGRDLAAILLFAPESHYYLTGFDTEGYVFFQCVVLTADDTSPTLLTRRPDLEQARITSIIEDVRIWYDAEGVNPAETLRGILAEKGLAGARIGVELNNYGLTGASHQRLRQALEGWCHLEDASDLVRGLRIVKSPAELAYVREAARLADDALVAMIATAGPGVFEGEVHAAGHAAIYVGGGDVAASPPVLGSGERALLVRASTGFRKLEPVDQLTLEFAASFRRYHVCLMRTVAIGDPGDHQRRMFAATKDALEAMAAAAKPSRPLGEIDGAHRRVFDAAGFGHARLAACSYSLGATYAPNWMDVPPMLYAGNPTPAEPGMVLFMHAILADARTGFAMSAGHTVVITETGPERLSRMPLDYALCRGTGFRSWAASLPA